MISGENVDKYFQEQLKFLDWKNVLEKDPVGFLRQYVRRSVAYIYYQNISLAAKDPAIRACPSENEIIEIGLSDQGGVCFSRSYFAYILLTSIGFDAFLIAGTVPCATLEGNHCMVVVKLSPDELYLVDVGMGQPIFDIIPLHNLPYQSMAFGFPYIYMYNTSEKMFYRIHKNGSAREGQFTESNNKKDNQDLFMYFDLTPRKYDDFVPTMTAFYADPTKFTLRDPFVTSFIVDNDEDFTSMSPNPTFVFSYGLQVIVGDCYKRQSTIHSSYESFLAELSKYFPKLKQNEIQLAMSVFKNCKKN